MSEPEDFEIARRLRELPAEKAPPPELEDRIVAALRDHGLVRSPAAAARRRPAPWQLAAAALVGVLGGWLGHARLGAAPAGPTSEGAAYLLLLSEPRALATEKPLAELVGEYRAWAGELAAEGRLLSSGRLTNAGRRLAPGDGGRVIAGEVEAPERATGFFLLRADSLEHASQLAATCPHLGYGGEISVRPLATSASEAG